MVNLPPPMFPILFRIPLPHTALKLWWALAAVAVIAVIYGALAFRREEKTSGQVGLGVAAAAGIAAYFFRDKHWEAPNLPIYSYGVMLGLSLVVGWYLTLGLADRDGLPKETMANCYVVTAVVALLGSRVLYVATNMEQFHSLGDVLSIRKGGYVAYGGFLGGFLGSWLYLRSQSLKLLPWADVAVPSLASGLLITRIGCYLFGCDFGKRLPEKAPAFLQKLGTFPHWAGKALDAGDGSPAFVRHRELFQGTPAGAELLKNNHSLPVHPTQIYESIVGLGLLGLLLWQRKHKRFDGQLFFLFVFAYGAIRFLLEIVRDDEERGEWGPAMAQHVLVPACLVLFALAFTFGISLGITNLRARMIARVASFLPAVLAYFALAPAKFGEVATVRLSTSQLIGLVTGLLVSYFYAKAWVDAGKGEVAKTKAKKKKLEEEEEDEDDEEDDEEELAPTKDDKKPAAKPAGKKPDSKPSGKKGEKDKPKPADEDDDEAPEPA